MARRLRIQFPGAIYHVYDRGNYRRDIFETPGAAYSFEQTLGEACVNFGWLVHAFTILRNHFHLALTTPVPNLADGMHWLLTTYAIRFNRFRTEQGHLFQGRFQSPLVQDASALVRVVDYIHLNSVRAGLVAPENVALFRWCSLNRFIRKSRPTWLCARDWFETLQLEDSELGWTRYLHQLISLSGDRREQEKRGFDEIERGHPIGSHGWRQALARRYSFRAIEQDLPHLEVHDLKVARWEMQLQEALQTRGKTRQDARAAPTNAPWKIDVAHEVRRGAGAPFRWIADQLALGSPRAVRVAVWRLAHR